MLIRYGLISLLFAIFVLGANLRADSPGEIIGTTTLESQSPGSMGNKIAVDQFGGIHAVWTKSFWSIPPHYAYYNFRSEVDSTWVHNPNGISISGGDSAGFAALDLLAGGEAIAAYHLAYATPAHPGVAVDAFRGSGTFTEYSLNPSDDYYFPQIAHSANSNGFHVVMESFGGPLTLGYAFSTDQGASWSEFAMIDTADLPGYIIAASPVSDKTVIVYFKHSRVGEFYDAFYNESLDGINWDFRFPINLTEFTVDDSLSIWKHIDAIYDYNDNIHIIYLVALIRAGDFSLNSTQLRHWSQITGHSLITTGPEAGCAQNTDCLCVAQPNLSIDPDNNLLFAVWSEMSFDDVSAGGYSNGELYTAYSHDYGLSWSPKVNITNSPTPGCAPMQCDCDIWVSLAEKVVDNKLHILYIDDNDAGVAWAFQGIWTSNEVLHLEFDTGNLIPVSVDDFNPAVPSGIKILRAYPNPFNARTTIEFALAEPGDVELTIYDVTGAKAETMTRPDLGVGKHAVVWDAEDVASGVYFARMEAGGYSQSIKMVLLK